MLARVTLLFLLASGCGPTMVVASMACDWGGTRQAAGERKDPWEAGLAKPIIGDKPSPATVDAYFAASTAIVLAGAQLVPERYRWIVYGTVSGIEAWTAYGNLSTTRGVCGIDNRRGTRKSNHGG